MHATVESLVNLSSSRELYTKCHLPARRACVGCRYVVDAGRAKQKLLEDSSSVHRYQVRWISQASANQRAGRAGRTGPGHCYRLFSSAVFNDMFPKFTAPEIQHMQLDSVVLSMHALGLPKVCICFWRYVHDVTHSMTCASGSLDCADCALPVSNTPGPRGTQMCGKKSHCNFCIGTQRTRQGNTVANWI
jgi:hypothetical protein